MLFICKHRSVGYAIPNHRTMAPETSNAMNSRSSMIADPYKLAKRVIALSLVPYLIPFRVAMFWARIVARRTASLEDPGKSRDIFCLLTADLMSIPDSMQIEILKALPVIDRLKVCNLSKALSELAAGSSQLWEDLVIDEEVQGHKLQGIDMLDSWLAAHSAVVKNLVLKGLKTSCDASTFVSFNSGILSTLLSKHFQASLRSLTIIECGSAVGAAEFAALSAMQHLASLVIQTEAQIAPSATSSLSALTRLTYVNLEVAPADRASSAAVTKYMGFPAGLVQLTALTSLRLSGWTHIDTIPNALSALKAISALSLSNCAMVTLPSTLQHLVKLGHLDLSYNGLGFFESHGYLGGTSRNPANTLPLLTQLTSLRLSVTGLRDLPRGISRLTGLQALHFAGNQLDPNHALSQTLVPLTALTKLVLQQCSLNAVPDGLSALSGLQWLCLSQNSLQLVPCGMPWQRLRALHLRFNELKSMPCTALSRASQLQHLDCGDNFPMQVESKSLKRSVIRRLPRLATIFIDKDPSIPNDVKWTQKSKTVIKHMEDYFSRKRPALQFFSDLSARPQE